MLEGGRKPIRNAGRPANQEMRAAPRCRLAAHLKREVGPVNPAGKMPSAKPAKPNQRHAIRHDHVGRVKDGLKCWIVLRLHDPMHAGNRDIAATVTMLNPLFDSYTYLWDLDRIHTHAQDSVGKILISHLVHELPGVLKSRVARDAMARS